MNNQAQTQNEVNPQKVVEILAGQLADKDVQIAMLKARISDLEEELGQTKDKTKIVWILLKK